MMLKPGVSLVGLQPQMCIASQVAEGVYSKLGAELVITSGGDSKHGPGSLHPKGLAIDIRTNTLKPATARQAADRIRQKLGAEFDVVLEKTHIHIEFQPKAPPEQVVS